MSEGIRLGLAMTGSYCTFDEVLEEVERLCLEFDVTPVMSEHASSTDSRFGTAEDFVKRLEELTGKKIIRTIAEAEPIGPKKLLDAMLIMPCTGNTMAKIANGITDTSVTMAAKAHMRNGRPLILALASNDALAGNARNLGALLDKKNVYFVPFGQDDAEKKPTSLMADFKRAGDAVRAALKGQQLQPLLLG